MEKWEKILRQSDAKVRDLPARPENWERLAADLKNPPPAGPNAKFPGSTALWKWWTGGAVTVALVAVASYAIFADPAPPASQPAPELAAAASPVLPEQVNGARTDRAASSATAQPIPEVNSAAAPAVTPPRSQPGFSRRAATTPSPSPAADGATGGGMPINPAVATTPSGLTGDSGSNPIRSTQRKRNTTVLANPAANHSAEAELLASPTEPEESIAATPAGAVAPLGTVPTLSLAIPARDLSGLSLLPQPDNPRWRVSLSYGAQTYDLSPWVPFYRLVEEIPNQESIVPEEGPDELFLVGEFQAFEAEARNNHYRILLEHRIGRTRLLAYGGIRHQRQVYRLDDERTDYTGTEADLLFRGRIRYRETGLEAGLTYQFKPFRWGLANWENRLEIRAGAHYTSERARIFDGTLQAGELPENLPFRYREELLPRYRWGFQAELIDRFKLSDRTELVSSIGIFTGSDGVVRFAPLYVGVLRWF